MKRIIAFLNEPNELAIKGPAWAFGLLIALMIFVLLSLSPVSAAERIRLCTGAANGNYFAAGDMIKKMAGSSLDIEVVETEGTIDNLDRLLTSAPDDAGACDAMIGQPDGPVYISRTSPANAKKLRQVASRSASGIKAEFGQ